VDGNAHPAVLRGLMKIWRHFSSTNDMMSNEGKTTLIIYPHHRDIEMIEILLIAGVDFTHSRLVELARLADQAEPFYLWVEKQFQTALSSTFTLNNILLTSSKTQIQLGVTACYFPLEPVDLPFLFDGVGRTYPHSKACYYFFSWLVRDAPQQRLGPLIYKILKNTGRKRLEVETEVLASLIFHYRSVVNTFSWEAIREVIIDRLEGSRRSLKGHEKETLVRTIVLRAIQHYYAINQHYGLYGGIEIPARQIVVNSETYDVGVHLLNSAGEMVRRILIPIKTRETEGGGHAHLFSRDLLGAIRSVRTHRPDDFLMVVIIARNWSRREAENLAQIVDHLIIVDGWPGDFAGFDKTTEDELNDFIANVFDGRVVPKRADAG